MGPYSMTDFDWNMIESARIRTSVLDAAEKSLMDLDHAMLNGGVDEQTREADLIAFMADTFSNTFAIRFAAHLGCISGRQAERIARGFDHGYTVQGAAEVARAAVADIIMNRMISN